MGPFLLVGIALAAIGMVLGSYLVVGSAEGLASRLRVSSGSLMLLLFPLATASPEIAVIAVGMLTGGLYGRVASVVTALGEPFIVLLLGVPAVAAAGLLRGSNPLSGARGGYAVPMLSPLVLLVELLLLVDSRILGPALIASGAALYFVASRERKGEPPRAPPARLAPVGFVAGIALVVVLTRALIELVKEVAYGFSASSTILLLLVFPLTTSSPEIIAGALFALKKMPEESVAALTGEFIIESTILPGLVALTGPISPQLVPLVSFTAVSSLITFVASRLRMGPYLLIPADLALLVAALLTL